MLVTAKQARALAERARDRDYDIQMAVAEEAVRGACQKGEYHCYVSVRLNESVVISLREMGYGVRDIPDQKDGDSTFISWQ